VGNCKDCSSWRRVKLTDGTIAPEFDAEGRATCMRLGTYANSKVQKIATVELKRNRAAMRGGELTHHAVVWTAPEFGCALFEPRAEPQLSPEAEDARKWCG
jgi:hypothetical protein